MSPVGHRQGSKKPRRGLIGPEAGGKVTEGLGGGGLVRLQPVLLTERACSKQYIMGTDTTLRGREDQQWKPGNAQLSQ
jgi:hypothetical protein